MTRVGMLVLLVGLAGCQCLRPVGELEPEDGGLTDAGSDAGAVTAPGDGGCDRFTDCTGPRPAMSLCGFAGPRDGGFSCIDHRCVYDCEPDRTCDTAFDAGCLDCVGRPRVCSGAQQCNFNQVAGIESDNGCPSMPGGLSLTPLTTGCGWSITVTATGRVVGTAYRLDDGRFVVHIPELGGTCTGFPLSTQVERWLLSCPACQVSLAL